MSGYRWAAIGAVALVVALTVTSCASAPAAQPAPTVSPRPAASESPTPTPVAEPLPAPPVGLAPAGVVIQSIGIDESLIDLGIQASGEMEVPEDYNALGWFTGGGRPGGTGPTVIAGHVDDGYGPAVFHRLDELAPGDEVSVTDVAGTRFRYVVTEVADYAKAQFPTARVFGASLRDELRLITCIDWDRGARTYVQNRVVFAERVD